MQRLCVQNGLVSEFHQEKKLEMAELKKSGIQKTVMLTGDAKAVAEQVADSLGIDTVCSELLPGDKVTVEMSPYDLSKGRITWRSK